MKESFFLLSSDSQNINKEKKVLCKANKNQRYKEQKAEISNKS